MDSGKSDKLGPWLSSPCRSFLGLIPPVLIIDVINFGSVDRYLNISCKLIPFVMHTVLFVCTTLLGCSSMDLSTLKDKPKTF